MALNALNNTLMIADWIPVVNGASSISRGVLGAGQAITGAACGIGGAIGGVTGLWKNGYSWMRFGGQNLGGGAANFVRGVYVLLGPQILSKLGIPKNRDEFECGALQTWFADSIEDPTIPLIHSWSPLNNNHYAGYRIQNHLILLATLIGYDVARGAASIGRLQTLTNLATKLEGALKPLDYLAFHGLMSGPGRFLLGWGQMIEGVGVTVGSALASIPNKILGAAGETQGAWSGIKYGLGTAKNGLLNAIRGPVAMVPWVGGKVISFYETTRVAVWVR